MISPSLCDFSAGLEDLHRSLRFDAFYSGDHGSYLRTLEYSHVELVEATQQIQLLTADRPDTLQDSLCLESISIGKE